MIKPVLNSNARAYLKKMENTPLVLGVHAFWVVLALVLLDIVIGVFFFYNYIFLAEFSKPAGSAVPVKFQEKTYKEVQSQWASREIIFYGDSVDEYSDPFH